VGVVAVIRIVVLQGLELAFDAGSAPKPEGEADPQQE